MTPILRYHSDREFRDLVDSLIAALEERRPSSDDAEDAASLARLGYALRHPPEGPNILDCFPATPLGDESASAAGPSPETAT